MRESEGGERESEIGGEGRRERSGERNRELTGSLSMSYYPVSK